MNRKARWYAAFCGGIVAFTLVVGCGGYGRGKGEGSGGGERPGGSSNGSGPISRDDTNAGTSGTGRGDAASSISGPRGASENSK